MINGHGGNIYQLADNLGCHVSEIIDMSSNVNPLGPIPELLSHLTDCMDSVAHLPQVDALAIREAFAQQHGLDPQLVLAGNGSTQWIYTLPLALKAKRALILAPAYSDYADACAMHGTTVQYRFSSAKDLFDYDLTRIFKLAEEMDLVFICNPNNPTGRLIPAEALLELCLSRPDTIFIIDESYLPFIRQSESHTLINRDLANAVIITSMSKIYRLPGLRIGFIKAPRKIIPLLAPYGLPWAVNSLASAAVLWLMQHQEIVAPFIDRSIGFIQKEKELFYQRVAHIKKLTCFESCTSYILIKLPENVDSKQVWNTMAKAKLLIRDCSNFQGLSSRFIRISLKDSENNLKAFEILENISQV
ncbi:MAG: aminotransferase class I/II-fold pyridoxal phosphate-dependent enzyme [Desulfobacteraceae bacterium]|jgi:threonine-phosphate decarboxylase